MGTYVPWGKRPQMAKEVGMQITEIAQKIKSHGGTLYLVGGAIRDKLLGRQINDEDYCVTGITSYDFQKLFPEAHVRGKSFEVFDIDGKEFAMARVEVKNGKGHKEFNIVTGKDISIEADLARRDVTINSMAENVLTGEIIDPFKGRDDLENGILRATTEKFKEDPLRVYRVARFSAQLGFCIENNTLQLMNSLKEELSTLSKERVFIEFRKALASNKPSNFFNSLRDAGVLEVHFEEIKDLIGSVQPEKYHPEGDSYNHTMLAVDKSVELTSRLEVRYSVLLHDLGKGVTPKEIQPHHYGHDKAGVPLVKALSARLSAPNSWRKCAVLSAEEHMRAGIFDKMGPAKQVKLLEKLSKSLLGLEGMEIVVECDKTSSRPDNDFFRFAELGKRMLEEINGKTINLENKQGKEIEETIKKERINWMKNLKRKKE